MPRNFSSFWKWFDMYCAPVVVADRDTAGDAVRESPEATAHALADGFWRLEAGRAGGGVEADAFGGEVVDRDRLKARRRPRPTQGILRLTEG
jgi:hypothetical protein